MLIAKSPALQIACLKLAAAAVVIGVLTALQPVRAELNAPASTSSAQLAAGTTEVNSAALARLMLPKRRNVLRSGDRCCTSDLFDSTRPGKARRGRR